MEFLADDEEGWYKGQVKGKIGVFPSNFVEEASSSTAPSGVTSTDGKQTHSATVSDHRPSKPPPPIPSEGGSTANHHADTAPPGELDSDVLCRIAALLVSLAQCYAFLYHPCLPSPTVPLPPSTPLSPSILHPSLSLHTLSLSLPPHIISLPPSTLPTSLPPTSPARPSATFGGKQVLPMGELPIKPSDLKKRPPPQPGGLATQGTTCKCCIVSQHCTFPNTCTCHHTIVLSLSLHLCTHLQPKFLLLTSLIRCVPSDTACPTLAPPSLGHLSSTHQ